VKFFLDENVNYGCLEPLRALYRTHEFRHTFDEGLSGTLDIPLFKTLREQRYHAISRRTGASFPTTRNVAPSSMPACIGSATERKNTMAYLAS
jgi:hypothetical protein